MNQLNQSRRNFLGLIGPSILAIVAFIAGCGGASTGGSPIVQKFTVRITFKGGNAKTFDVNEGTTVLAVIAQAYGYEKKSDLTSTINGQTDSYGFYVDGVISAKTADQFVITSDCDISIVRVLDM